MKTGYHKKDWFVALVAGIVLGVALLARSPWLERLELIAYDIGVTATHRTPGASDQIVIVAIDDPSLAEIGRWPWPRRVLAEALERLSKAEPRAVGVLIDLTEPQTDAGLLSIRHIREKMSAMPAPNGARTLLGQLRALLNQAESELDTDRALTQALAKTPGLHLPMFVDAGAAPERPGGKVPEYLQRHRFAHPIVRPEQVGRPPSMIGIRAPLEPFGRQASGIGHLSFPTDSDGGVRAVRAALAHDGSYYPTLPLLLAASSLRLDLRHIELDVGKGMKLGKLYVPTDRDGRTYTGFYAPPAGDDHAFSTFSFRDLRAGKLPPSLFTNKIVLIGLTAAGVGTAVATPLTATNAHAVLSEPALTANAIASILNQDFYTTPDWSGWAASGVALFLVLYLMFLVPRIGGKTAALASLLLLVALLGAEQYLLVTQKMWLPAVSPGLLLVVGHLAIVMKRFVLGERQRAQTDSSQSDRLLGLAFQSQGQLDMAMDKFRKLPADESVLDLIYSVALDFERKRQFHKAAAAYDYILDHRPSFRDCLERKKRASQGDQSIALGKTMILDGAEKPTLGRYHIEKELGRGEMGIVYLGLDPKINRRVAIKTMVLSQELQAKELGNVRERFFREAEAAGRLHHPNIVTIYDVGEEHDLAYIAMEYLEGKELATYIQPGKPLAFAWILDVAIKVVDALAYAHRHDVVHRDIKPSNIVYHEASGGVKVMDFGIARIAAASRTQTGLVLGTPSYMSPEQISGKRVDGRSDLFAFGSMLFEMISGDTPFTGDTFAALTHQIINAPTPDIRKFRPDTPARLHAIVKRLLLKPVTKRYQTGEELKRDLEQCRSTLNEAAKT